MFNTHKFDEIEEALLAYFKKHVTPERRARYFKAKQISQDIGMYSSNKIGTCLGIMSDKKFKNVKIIHYSDTSSATWKVEFIGG